ncbi:hypothetical protein B0H17DRAFT_1198196 [Mycena rosella]|uniref:Uncharacterized protein n=1 Tax=Mycena rosella TaxID=1033263 RepID=A0AAD7DPT5_MYCRO|nr:hypothetical protein B0H17DRAFT_1198196 [Mycena rosella]
MKLSAAFFALVPFVAAIPAPGNVVDTASTTAVISARTQGNVFVCTEAGFLADCAIFHGASNQCVDLTPDFNDVISAIGPDPDQDCFFWTDPNCIGEQLGPIRSPGIANLNVGADVPFNDNLSSFK